METGNAIIDSEHRQLFDAINKLMDACSKGQGRNELEKTVNFLSSYVENHFSHEERLQINSQYPNYNAHKLFHENYKNKLKTISNDLIKSGATIVMLNNLNMHASTLISHIKLEDKKLAQFLNSK